MKELNANINDLAGKIERLPALLHLPKQEKKLADLTSKAKADDFWQDSQCAASINKQISDIQDEISNYQVLRDEVETLQGLMLEIAEDDIDLLKEIEVKYREIANAYQSLEFLTLFSGQYDRYDIVMTINSGAGGDEAQDWVAMLLRMYLRFAEQRNWSAEIISASRGSEAGYKNVVLEIKGKYAYGQLRSESGVHRLVRLSPFDADQARHTSFAMVDILPIIEEALAIQIDPKDIRIDTYRASGAGGQKVNKTDSAVRVVHEPTGIIVTCQNERSQAQNKETAMKILKSKLQLLQDLQVEEEKRKLKGEITDAAWGNQIRSYVLHPYKLVKDHRTDFQSTDPDKVLAGDLADFIQAYLIQQQHEA
ncbi:MAG: peptide chain release factor 2 [Candidatus Komeilibacteria bacterium]